MNVLALVPPDKKGKRAARYSFLYEELAAMAARDVHVHAVSPFVTSECRRDGVAIHPIPRVLAIGHSLRSLPWLAHPLVHGSFAQRSTLARTLTAIVDVVRNEKIDVIYSPFAWPNGSAGVPAAQDAGVPVVVSLRGADIMVEESVGYGRMRDARVRAAFSKILQNVDHVIGVSRALVDRAVEFGVSPDKTSVVLKGVDWGRFSIGDAADARQKLTLPERPTILFAGNFIALKGIDCLLESFKLVQQVIPQAQLVMCGDGEEFEPFRLKVHDAGLENDVHLVGRIGRDKIADYFRACDVFALPSLSEGSGNVLIEAAACGKPTLGSNVAGIPDYIDDGLTGYLFEKGNPQDLSEKLIRILSDAEHARQLGLAGRERVERLHGYDQMIDAILETLEQTCRHSKPLVATT